MVKKRCENQSQENTSLKSILLSGSWRAILTGVALVHGLGSKKKGLGHFSGSSLQTKENVG
jgi:hypothetical protein